MAAIDPAGASLLYSFYFGGKKSDYGYAIATDNSGGVYIAGLSYSSTNFPLEGSIQSTNRGKGDAFIAKFSPSTMLVIERADSQILVKWPAPTPGYGLEMCHGLAGGWSPVSQKPKTAEGWNVVTLPPTTASCFFRLSRQLP